MDRISYCGVEMGAGRHCGGGIGGEMNGGGCEEMVDWVWRGLGAGGTGGA